MCEGAPLLFYHVHYLEGHTAQSPTGPIWGVAFLVPLVGQLCSDQISFDPLPHPKIHHRVNMDGIPNNVRNHVCWADLQWLK